MAAVPAAVLLGLVLLAGPAPAGTYDTYTRAFARFTTTVPIAIGNLGDPAAERELLADARQSLAAALDRRRTGLRDLVARFLDGRHAFTRWRHAVGGPPDRPASPPIGLPAAAGLPPGRQNDPATAPWPGLSGPLYLRLHAAGDPPAIFVDLAALQFVAHTARLYATTRAPSSLLERWGGGISVDTLRRLLGDRTFYADFPRKGLQALLIARAHSGRVRAWAAAAHGGADGERADAKVAQRRFGARLLLWTAADGDLEDVLAAARQLPDGRALASLVLVAGLMNDAAWRTDGGRVRRAIAARMKAADLSDNARAELAPLAG